jgi:hypothetical protein
MSRPSKAELHATLHEEAMREFGEIQTAQRDGRLQCLQDRRFYSIAGAQWEGSLSDQFENKPRFEVNKIHLAVIRIFNEYRNNRITVNFVSKEGSDNGQLADTCAALYRADEQDSVAEEAYDNAFEEAVGGGFGAWRLRTAYENDEDDEDDRQRIRIEPIFDADSSVFFDLNAKRQDKSDASACYVLTAYSRSAYEAEFGSEDFASWPKHVFQHQFDWLTPDLVYVAEYYRVEEQKEVVHIYEGLDGQEKRVRSSELAADDTLEDILHATGFREVRQKKLKRRRIHKYIMSGKGILEDCGYIAGKHIPIVPMYGKRWFIDNIERCMGHVRLSKDAQRLKNMQLSKLGEISAMSSVEKPIFTPEQISSHQTMWAEDNIKNYPYLLVNPLTDGNGNVTAVGPVAYTKAPEIPVALGALLQITEQDMQDMLGNQQAGEQLQSNISGEAIQLVQGKLDMQTFIYMSNMSKAIKRSGEIWLGMAKDILVEEGRKMKGLGGQDEVSSIELMKPVANQDTGSIDRENDLSAADFDVGVDVGPSSASKRQATVRNLTGMMQMVQDPETIQVLGAMAMMNMEGEGIREVRDFFRKKLVRMGVVKPTDEEARQLQAEAQNQQPDPQSQFLQASAEQAQAQAAKSRADTVLVIAKSEETKARTAETLSNMDLSQRKQMLESMKTLNEMNNQPTQPQGGEMPPPDLSQFGQ